MGYNIEILTKKDNFFVMLHVYNSKSIQKNTAYFISVKVLSFGKEVLKGSNPNMFKHFTLYHKRKMSLPKKPCFLSDHFF